MKIVAFAGGVGGGKLVDGLAQCLLPEDLTIIVNTGDDFEHWGLRICPDLDTVCYTLANLANPETGWGRSSETWEVFENVRQIGGPDWFRIGDKDLATHLERTRRLNSGQPLSKVVQDFCAFWKISPNVIPMTDDPAATIVDTIELGEITFQEYFVHQQCNPTVKGFILSEANNAKPSPGVINAIQDADAIIFCPSNPWVSIDPILSIAGILPSLLRKKVIAVSPIIAGQTIKGPAAKMFKELGIDPSCHAVAKHYQGLLSGFVFDQRDSEWANAIASLGMTPHITESVMKNRNDRLQLAKDVLNFIEKEIIHDTLGNRPS